jgi:hypothetical protein
MDHATSWKGDGGGRVRAGGKENAQNETKRGRRRCIVKFGALGDRGSEIRRIQRRRRVNDLFHQLN